MSGSIATFSSPLGALHHAHPSTATSHTPFSGLFTKKTSASSPSPSSKKRSSTSIEKKTLQISRPVLISTSNGGLPAATPLYPSVIAPPPFSSASSHVCTFSASSLMSTGSSASSSRSSSPPPPYSHSNRDSFLNFDADEDEPSDSAPVVAPLVEKALVDTDVVEARMHSWDVERLQQEDARLVSELRRLGF
ncbi:hypothetical protein JCM11251_002181 [Rhodosporidiobolus azoricus]